MKLILKILVLIVVVSFTSCSDIPKLSPQFKANIHGETWNSNVQLGIQESTGLTITAYGDDGGMMIVNVLGNSIGNYKLTSNGWENSSSLIYRNNQFDDLTEAYISYEGEVNITDINDEFQYLSGDFKFNMIHANDTIRIDSGVFTDIEYNQP